MAPRTKSISLLLRGEAAEWSDSEPLHNLLLAAATEIEDLTSQVEELRRGQAATQAALQVPDYPPDSP